MEKTRFYVDNSGRLFFFPDRNKDTTKVLIWGVSADGMFLLGIGSYLTRKSSLKMDYAMLFNPTGKEIDEFRKKRK